MNEKETDMLLEVVLDTIGTFVMTLLIHGMGCGILRVFSGGRYPPKFMDDRAERIVLVTGILAHVLILLGFGFIAVVFFRHAR